MKSCKREASIKTLRDVGIWSAVGTVVVASIILVFWGIDTLIRLFATHFPSAAKTIEFGCENSDQINIVGDDYKNFVCRDFQIPPQVSLRFSLAHICRSIGKQIIILAKTRGGRKT